MSLDLKILALQKQTSKNFKLIRKATKQRLKPIKLIYLFEKATKSD